MNKKIKERIDELVKLINQWNKEYFDEETPSVSDRVYDSYLEELIQLENKYPEYKDPHSPTNKIGASIKTKFKKVIHTKPMLSLNKAYSYSELEKFFNDVLLVTNNKNINFLIQPKIDGLSIGLKYKNGELFQAVTRGDGSIGEDVTLNIKNIIKDIPTKIDYLEDLEVRGEVYIGKKTFKEILEKEQVDYANSRNLASGTLRQLDSNIVKKRNLSCFIYEIVDYEKHNIKSQVDLINFLKNNHFPYLTDYKVESYNNYKNIFDFIKKFEDGYKDQLEFDIDGMVLKLNEIEYYEEIGYTSKFPKYAIAYKFDEELIETTLDDIFVTIGRTGIVTYNAKLKTVLLKGTMVSAATLHNYNYIVDLNLNIKDQIMIKKAGEIIPKVVSVKKKNSNGLFPKIIICPYCNNKLIDTRTGNNQICINSDCPEINIKKIIHFASRQAANIEGLGEGFVRKFYEYGFIKKIEDIYTLEKHKNEIINLKGYGDKFFDNLISGINNSYNVSLEKLLFALGIGQLGSKGSKLIAKKIKKFSNILSFNINELINIKDVGEITKNEFQEYLNKKENISLINFLISIGINPEFENTTNTNIEFFKNKTFVISGTFDISRNELSKIIEENEGNVSSAISKNTFALLLGEKGGSKEAKAKALGIKIISKDELEKILKN